MGKSRLQRDLEDGDRIKDRLGIEVGAPIFPDTRLNGLVGRFFPILPKIALVSPVSAIASDHHESTIGERFAAQEVEYKTSSPNRKDASSKMRHHRNK